MKFWTEKNIKDFAQPLCDRSVDRIHQSILAKHRQRLDWEDRKKLKNLVDLRPPTQSQKTAVLSLSQGGECDRTIDSGFVKDCLNHVPRWQKNTKKQEAIQGLDTLALLRTRVPAPEKKQIDAAVSSKLRKRAASKYHTNQYLPGLIALNSPLKNS